MSCTTLLVGRLATNDGSTIVARNEDGEDFSFNPKKLVVINPEDQPRTYTGVTNHLTIELPDDPIRYTLTPNADPSQGVWGEAGINAANVSMSSTETISANARVLGADPLVNYQPAVGKPGEPGYKPEVPGGIGEENLPTITLPYIKSAREGVQRLGMLVEKYGTYETNGVAFGDEKDVWYWENIGGHHWIARRVPDDSYVVQPNRQGIDHFDLADALGEQHDYMCSAESGPVDSRPRPADGHACPRRRLRRDGGRASALLQCAHRLLHLHLARPALQRATQVVPLQPLDAFRPALPGPGAGVRPRKPGHPVGDAPRQEAFCLRREGLALHHL